LCCRGFPGAALSEVPCSAASSNGIFAMNVMSPKTVSNINKHDCYLILNCVYICRHPVVGTRRNLH
jgi:hypothetical protein